MELKQIILFFYIFSEIQGDFKFKKKSQKRTTDKDKVV